MIVRILNNNYDIPGFYYSYEYKDSTKSAETQVNRDVLFNVSHWLVLPRDVADELMEESKHESLDFGHHDHKKTYGVYKMTEEDIALWLLRI